MAENFHLKLLQRIEGTKRRRMVPNVQKLRFRGTLPLKQVSLEKHCQINKVGRSAQDSSITLP